MKIRLCTALVVATLAVTTACGGGDSGDNKSPATGDTPSAASPSAAEDDENRPSAEEIANSLVKENTTLPQAEAQKLADCGAKLLVASDISDEALRAIAEGDREYKESAADGKALDELGPKIASQCRSSE